MQRTTATVLLASLAILASLGPSAGAQPAPAPSASEMPASPAASSPPTDPAVPAPGAFPTIPPGVDRGTYVPTAFYEAHVEGAPAWNAFVDAEKLVNDYTMTVTSHEVEGAQTEDRVYHFGFMRPTYGITSVISGPGAGKGAVWHGGLKIKGHLTGMFAHLKAIMPMNDPRAVDLRGKTMVEAYFPWIVNGFELASGGKLSESPGPAVDGVPTTAVTIVPLDPARDGGCTTEQLLLSNVTHLPVEHDCQVGAIHAEHEVFSEVKVNVGLTPAYFDFI